jgi:uncharacterized damage-inducible protein DinB
MPDLQISKPAAGEYNPYYSKYIDLVPDGDVVGTLASQIGPTLTALRAISDADSLKRYAAGKWSIREMLGHVNDGERIFAYRALRIARGDQTPLPGFEQDDYIAPGKFDARSWSSLIDEFEIIRKSTLALFRGFDEEAWRRTGTASENPVSVRALAYMIAGHERHHMNVLREKYL